MNRDDYLAIILIGTILILAGLVATYMMGLWNPNVDIVFPFGK